jgi:ArsR family transcriptional regulator, arsenate/arsenite/antimonite-responsive transcriptional repressor
MVGTVEHPPDRLLAERVAILKAIADPTRLRVIDELAVAGALCHCDLEAVLAVPANRLSFHLRTLRDAGLVHTRRNGRNVEYTLADGGMESVMQAISCPDGKDGR